MFVMAWCGRLTTFACRIAPGAGMFMLTILFTRVIASTSADYSALNAAVG